MMKSAPSLMQRLLNRFWLVVCCLIGVGILGFIGRQILAVIAPQYFRFLDFLPLFLLILAPFFAWLGVGFGWRGMKYRVTKWQLYRRGITTMATPRHGTVHVDMFVMCNVIFQTVDGVHHEERIDIGNLSSWDPLLIRYDPHNLSTIIAVNGPDPLHRKALIGHLFMFLVALCFMTIGICCWFFFVGAFLSIFLP